MRTSNRQWSNPNRFQFYHDCPWDVQAFSLSGFSAFILDVVNAVAPVNTPEVLLRIVDGFGYATSHCQFLRVRSTEVNPN